MKTCWTLISFFKDHLLFSLVQWQYWKTVACHLQICDDFHSGERVVAQEPHVYFSNHILNEFFHNLLSELICPSTKEKQ